ncbi:MAG: cytochrome oxidase assembly protein [Lacunisphaera sp.]|nr:cytochrome oxidase assembly protein [Lacunisphaera sp.]
MNRTSTYKPGLAWFAALSCAWVFVLVALGAFTTSIGAGMAFPDWPLSNGSINPSGWLTEIDKFAEHSHRLSAAVMSTLTYIIGVWIWRQEERAWLRQLALFAALLVVGQALVGGLRVLFDHLHIAALETSAGRLFAMLHAVLAQMFVCTLLALALACSRPWIEAYGGLKGTVGPRTIALGRLCVALLFGQLAVAAIMRHSQAGLAMPTFPLTPEGGLLPAHWDFRVAIHFTHRLLAAAITIALAAYGHVLWRDAAVSRPMRALWMGAAGLLALQIYLGAQIIWTGRSVTMTTGHVIIGALTLAATFVVAFFTHRDSIEPART